MLIDSHVNLHAPQFADDQAEVIERARAAGVGLMVTICDRVSSFEAVHAIAVAHDDIWCTVGTHPHEAKENPDLSPGTLVRLAERSKVVGIGETGLDFHYDFSPRPTQIAVFQAHIAAARETGLPLVVHSREADAVMAELLEAEHARGPFKLLLHCYTSGAELARRAAALGAWFSVSGIATFKAAETLGRSSGTCRPTGSSWRRTVPTSRPFRCGVGGTSRRTCRTCSPSSRRCAAGASRTRSDGPRTPSSRSSATYPVHEPRA
jgi:TatD DNase family protein